jgi:hypothetical protein
MALKIVEGTDRTCVLPDGLARILRIESLSDPRTEDDPRYVVVTYQTSAGPNFVVVSEARADELGLEVAFHTGSLVPIPKRLHRPN